jgi:hypothetical protein
VKLITMVRGGPQAVKWVFTIWPGHLDGAKHHTLKDWDRWARTKFRWDGVKYLVFQTEKATSTENEHIQGFIQFSQRKRVLQVEATLGLKPNGNAPTKANGTANDSKAYCTDPDKRVEGTIPFEYGELPKGQGERTDLQRMAESIREKGLKRTMSEADTGLDTTYMKYHRGAVALDQLAAAARIPAVRDIRVYVAYGPAGSGKSHYALHYDPTDTFVLPDAGKDDAWFDGYAGERTLVIEEMEPDLIRYNTMKRICDKYVFDAKVKGSYVRAAWDRVIITSNYHPNRWYKDDVDPWGVPESPMQRRISQIIEFKGKYMAGTAMYRTEANQDWRAVETLGSRAREIEAEIQPIVAEIVEALGEEQEVEVEEEADCAEGQKPDSEDELLRELNPDGYEGPYDFTAALNAGLEGFNSGGTDVDWDQLGLNEGTEPAGENLFD